MMLNSFAVTIEERANLRGPKSGGDGCGAKTGGGEASEWGTFLITGENFGS